LLVSLRFLILKETPATPIFTARLGAAGIAKINSRDTALGRLNFLQHSGKRKVKEGSHGFFLISPRWTLECLLPQRGFSQEKSAMKQEDELAMKVTKEIVIKFIEVGRLSVNTFDEVFRQVHTTVVDTLRSSSSGKVKGEG
jgi:hypothetical protein